MTVYADRQGSFSSTLVPPTEKQVAFARKLVSERQVDAEKFEVLVSTNAFDKQSMSRYIDQLLQLPKRESKMSTAKSAELEDGVYLLDGTVYKVQHAVHGSGHQYAKQLIVDGYGDAHFEYARGVVHRLRPEHKMTQEQAREFGALYGTCCRCGRTLTAEDSIERMMGPVCFGKMGW